MKLETTHIPVGALPYADINLATRMMAKVMEKNPYIPIMPLIDEQDTIVYRTIEGLPGIKVSEQGFLYKNTTSHYKEKAPLLEKAFNYPTMENLENFSFQSPFLEKFLQMIKKFKSPNAVINLLGPFTILQTIHNLSEDQNITDKGYRRLFIQGVCVKALWIIEKIKEFNPDCVPIIMLEEPMLAQFGNIRRENEEVTSDLITGMYEKITEKLKSSGAIVGVQCFDKCDWQIPINGGIDIISFDAYNNPNNLNIIPEQITEFIARGGKINWGIVPVMSEETVKSLNIAYLTKRLLSTMQGLIVAGVPSTYVYKSALVSCQNDLYLPIIFAEKAIILTSQLSKKIPSKPIEN